MTVIADRRLARGVRKTGRPIDRSIMMREYSSFLIRRWRLADGRERVEVEHSQTGQSASLVSLAETVAWIEEIGFAADEANSAAPPAGEAPRQRDTSAPTGSLPVTATLDAGAENCAQLIMNVRKAITPLDPGQVLAVQAYDPSAQVDLRCWCGMTGHGYLGMDNHDDYSIYYLQRRGDSDGKGADIR